MNDHVRIAFEDRTIMVPLASIMPLRTLKADTLSSPRFKRIAASVAEVGVIEPIVVSPASAKEKTYVLLDGHLRLAILQNRGETMACCLVALDEDPFTYNKRVSHLAAVQEHFMIMRALERGVSEKKIADALDVDVDRIKRQRTLLDGICQEAVDMLNERQIPAGIFPPLKRMTAGRQVEAIELMASCGNFTATYANALLAGTKQSELAQPDKKKKVCGLTHEQMARMEHEMAGLQGNFKTVVATFGNDMLELVVASGYVSKLLRNPAIERYLAERHSEFLDEFRTIVASSALGQSA